MAGAERGSTTVPESVLTFEGRCGGVRVAKQPRREPSALELAEFHAAWWDSPSHWLDRVVAWTALMAGGGAALWAGTQWLGVPWLLIGLAAVAGAGSGLGSWFSQERGYLLWRWRRAQVGLVARGAVGPTALELIEAPAKVTLRADDSQTALLWEVDASAVEIVGVRAFDAAAASAGAGGGVLTSGALGLERRAVHFELTRSPREPDRVSLSMRPEGDGDRVSTERGVVLELDRLHLVSDEAFEALPVLDRDGIRLSPEGAMVLLGRLRPLLDALGSPLPRSIGESRRVPPASLPASPGQMDAIFQDFANIFGETFFKGSGAARRGADLQMELPLSLATAVEGGRVDLEVDGYTQCEACRGVGQLTQDNPQRCATCDGTGKLETRQGPFAIQRVCEPCGGAGYGLRRACRRCEGLGYLRHRQTLKVTIPAGVTEESRIRLKGKGLPGPNGAGDLYLSPQVEATAGVMRDGRNLHVELGFEPEAMRLGGEQLVHVLGRPITFSLPPGTRHDTVLRVPGQGGRSVGEAERGDLFVRVLARPRQGAGDGQVV